MLWMLPALLLVFAVMTPVTFQADVFHDGHTQLHLTARAAGFHRTWQHQTSAGAAAGFRQSRSGMLAEALFRADKARRFLLHHIRLDVLGGLLLLRTEDAARSALWAGALQGGIRCIPAARRKNVHLQIWPDFFRAHSTLRIRCIIRIKLGTLLLTAGLLLLAWFREKQLTESEAT